MYEMSVVNVPKKLPKRTGFRHIVTLVQIGETSGLDNERVEKVRNWVEKYAGDDMKFEVQKKISGKFNAKEKKALMELKKVLEEKVFKDDKELFDKFYEICDKATIENTDFFAAAYRTIIGKEKGPRLASLILMVGQKEIVELLGTLR